MDENISRKNNACARKASPRGWFCSSSSSTQFNILCSFHSGTYEHVCVLFFNQMYLFSSSLLQLWSLCAYVIEWMYVCECKKERKRRKKHQHVLACTQKLLLLYVLNANKRKSVWIVGRNLSPFDLKFSVRWVSRSIALPALHSPYIHTGIAWCIKWTTWCANEVKLIQSVLRVFYFDFLSLFVCDCVCFSLGFFAAKRLLHSLIEMRGYTHTIQHIFYHRRTGE